MKKQSKFFLKRLLISMILFCSATIANESSIYLTSIANTALHRFGTDPFPLTTIQGKHVRMVTFTNDNRFKITDKKLSDTIWVTVEPEVKRRCRQYMTDHRHLTHRQLTEWIVKLLGLPADQASSFRFVVMNVPVIQAYYGRSPKRIGIFRPCMDPRISPHPLTPTCPLQMNSLDTQISSDYKTWFINTSAELYTSKKIGSPWTEYGYTYNWNSDAHTIYGVSEFVILKETPMTVLPNPNHPTTAYVEAEEYCTSKNSSISLLNNS